MENSSVVELFGIMMVKNESTNIERSIRSCKGLDGMYIYDTGSTDDTIEVTKRCCAENGLKCSIITGQFVNFCVSRNILVDHARDDTTISKNKVKWLVLLDANDELQGGEKLKNFVQTLKDETRFMFKTKYENLKATTVDQLFDNSVASIEELRASASGSGEALQILFRRDGVYLRQRWKTDDGSFTMFKNIRCIRSDTQLRFAYVVHEVLIDQTQLRLNIYAGDDVIMYQDRSLDTTMSSERRWIRDRKMLQKEIDKSKGLPDTRYVHYLAQTLKCLGMFNESAVRYRQRYNMLGGFQEEIFVSAFEVGKIYFAQFADNANKFFQFKDDRQTVHNHILFFLLEACRLDMRVEPLMFLVNYYALLYKNCFDKTKSRGVARIMDMLLLHSLKIKYPLHILLWYDEPDYRTHRYQKHAQHDAIMNSYHDTYEFYDTFGYVRFKNNHTTLEYFPNLESRNEIPRQIPVSELILKKEAALKAFGGSASASTSKELRGDITCIMTFIVAVFDEFERSGEVDALFVLSDYFIEVKSYELAYMLLWYCFNGDVVTNETLKNQGDAYKDKLLMCGVNAVLIEHESIRSDLLDLAKERCKINKSEENKNYYKRILLLK